ncbi:hypothetical protein AB4259_19500 [Vibrio amylolyticus]|uniref:hypothetical protein n=1 Tax=Vibrio amylolyticus TaxID=2847292 RepID=UPI003550FF8D
MSPPDHEQMHSSASSAPNQQAAPSGSTEFQWTMNHLNKLDDKVSKHISDISGLSTTVDHQSTSTQELKTNVNLLTEQVTSLKRVIYAAGVVIAVVSTLAVFFFGSSVQEVLETIKALDSIKK